MLVSLFAVGLKLTLPLSDRRWRAALRLATLSMLITIALLAAIGVVLFDLPLGAAILLAAMLAPTDPVLASDVQLADPNDRDSVRFSLTGEGGLNDGAAFPFVMLGLALLGLRDPGAGYWRWMTLDLVWPVAGGLAIGALCGYAIGKLVLYLRTRHQEAVGLDEFLMLGLDRRCLRRCAARCHLRVSCGVRRRARVTALAAQTRRARSGVGDGQENRNRAV